MKTKKIKLQFADDMKNSKMLTVDYPKAEISGSDIKTAMDEIVNSQALLGKEGPIQAKVKAYEEVIEKNTYNIGE